MSRARGYNNDRNFSYNGLTIRVSSDDASHLNWLEEFLDPQFEINQGFSHDCKVVLTADTQQYEDMLEKGAQPDGKQIDCFALESGVVRLPLWASGGNDPIIFDERFGAFYAVNQGIAEIRILTANSDNRARTSLMRVVRELAMNHSRRTGSLIIHGSGFVVEGRGVLIAGPKRAGKTTLLIHVLRQGTSQYLSNDRVVVSFERERPTLRGMPTIVALREGTLEMFPHLYYRLLVGSLRYLDSRSETTQSSPPHIRPGKDRRFNLSPWQLCELLQVGSRAQGEAQALLFPRVTGEAGTVELEQLSPEAAAVRLSKSLFGAGPALLVSTVFALSGNDVRPAQATLESLCLRLTSQARCYECRLGEEAFQSEDSVAMFLRHVMG
jgi:hypothetical protein